ncbi:MAG: DUF6152 family protein [Steroidobacteraceae bacterium]
MPADAHHSTSQFDLDTVVTIKGTVLKLQWTNPHVFIQLLVDDANGQAVEWSLEGPNPGGLARVGWRANSLKPGDKVTIVYNPLRIAGPGGFALGVITADGKQIGQTDVQQMRINNAKNKL